MNPYLIGADVLGDTGDKTYTDKATVRRVQQQLHALALATGKSVFDPYHDQYKDDGVMGSRTKTALAAFNSAYGWSTDGSTITDGTLEALKRPDVINPAAATPVAAPTQQAAPVSFSSPSPATTQPAAASSVPYGPETEAQAASPTSVFAPSAPTRSPAFAFEQPARSPSAMQRSEPRAAASEGGSQWGKIVFASLGVVAFGGVVWLLAGRKSSSRRATGESIGSTHATLHGMRRAR